MFAFSLARYELITVCAKDSVIPWHAFACTYMYDFSCSRLQVQINESNFVAVKHHMIVTVTNVTCDIDWSDMTRIQC